MEKVKKLLIEIDSINWYGTEYWLSVFEGFKLNSTRVVLRLKNGEKDENLFDF